MSRVLATYNIKGGVGKTSAAVNLAYLAARDGCSTLLWDLDPQGASTYLFRVKPKVRGGGAQAGAAASSDVAALIKGTDTRASTCCPPTSPTATWTWRSTSFKRPTRRLRARARAAAGRVRLRLPRLPAEHLAGVRERVRGRRRAARPDHPRDAVVAHLRQLEEVVDGGPEVLGVLLHGRPAQAPAPRGDGGAAGRARRAVLEAAIPPRPRSSGWASSATWWPRSRPGAGGGGLRGAVARRQGAPQRDVAAGLASCSARFGAARSRCWRSAAGRSIRGQEDSLHGQPR